MMRNERLSIWKIRIVAAALALVATLIVQPAWASGEGTPGYVLDVPLSSPNGTDFEGSITTPGPHLVVLMASLDIGEIPTQWGALNLGLPLLMQVIAFTDSTGYRRFSCPICDENLIGAMFYLQFLGVDMTDPSKGGVSNLTSFTISDGFCSGDFSTFTPGGWGTECNGQNPGCIRDEYFSAIFPAGVIIGDPDGPDGDDEYALLFTSSKAVENFLPAGEEPEILDTDQTDPLVSSAGTFAGHLLAAKLNVAFDAAGVLPKGSSTLLGDLIYVDCVDEDLLGLSVNEVIDISDKVISGAMAPPAGVDVTDLKDALDALNNNFPEGEPDKGCLGYP
jgi:hypothetical protein